MRSWDLDREALVRRNRRLAAALNQPSRKHRLRNSLLRLIAGAPIKPNDGDAGRVLMIRPDHFGDMLLMTPAIKALKRGRPELSIHVLCGPWCAELLENYEEADRVLTLPFPGFQRDGGVRGNPYKLALQSARQLRRIGYDSALIMRPDHWWGALLATLAGIPQRIGYDLPGVSPFLTAARPLEHQHVVLQNLRLVEAMGLSCPSESIQLEFPLRPVDRDGIDATLADLGIAGERRVVCIHPGSGAASKAWPPEKWARVADAVVNSTAAAIVFTGTAAEKAMIDDIVRRMPGEAASLAGLTNAGQLAALYRRSLAVLGVDSGALHMAAAVHKPTVTLFGPADPIEFAPWGEARRHAVVTADIACRPCRILDWRADDPEFHPCVREISVGQVLEALQRVLSKD